MPWIANNNQAGPFRAATTFELTKNENISDRIKFSLKVFKASNIQELCITNSTCAYANPEDLTESILELLKKSCCHIFPRINAQFLLSLRISNLVPKGHIVLHEISIINLELCVGEVEQWSIYTEKKDILSSVVLEVRPLKLPSSKLTLNSKDIVKTLKGVLWRQLVTEVERVAFMMNDIEFFGRVIEIEGDEIEQDEFTITDLFRGLVEAETDIYIVQDNSLYSNLLYLELDTKSKKPQVKLRKDIVDITTKDDEYFPVKKKLLQPCLALTSAVLAGSGVHLEASTTITVDVDCLTFDRVLLYLEHEAKGCGESFSFDNEHAEVLLKAAMTLGCDGLVQVCKKKAGEFESRVRKHAIPWDEVITKNKNGEIWLVMDGMVFDVTRWLPEHPGGSVIIPNQALNMDCTTMFEIYHSSRQSFRYLKQFYIGELQEVDRSRVPCYEMPSSAFMEELRQYSTWRIKPEEKVHKSF